MAEIIVDTLIAERDIKQTEFEALENLLGDDDEDYPMPDNQVNHILLRMSLLDRDIKFLTSCIMSCLDDVITELFPKTAQDEL